MHLGVKWFVASGAGSPLISMSLEYGFFVMFPAQPLCDISNTTSLWCFQHILSTFHIIKTCTHTQTLIKIIIYPNGPRITVILEPIDLIPQGGENLKLPMGKITNTVDGGEESVKGLMDNLINSKFTGYIEIKGNLENSEALGQLVFKEGEGVLAEYGHGGKSVLGKDSLKDIVKVSMDAGSKVEVHESIDADMMVTFFKSASISAGDFDLNGIMSEIEEEERKRKEEEERKAQEEAKKNELVQKIEGWKGQGYITTRLDNTTEMSLAELEQAVTKFEEDIKTLSGIESKLEEILPKAKGFEHFVQIIESQLNNPDSIQEMMTQIEAIEKGIAEQEERRDQLRQKVQVWKDQGYLTDKLEQIIEDDLEKAWELFTQYMDDIQRLKDLDEKLMNMETKGFDDETMAIETHLNNPEEVNNLTTKIDALEKLIAQENQAKEELKGKVNGWQESGFKVDSINEVFGQRLAKVQEAMGEFEQNINRLTALKTEFESLNFVDFQSEADELSGQLNDPSVIGDLEFKFRELKGKKEETDKRRAEITAEIEALKGAGYNVETVESAYEQTIDSLEEAYKAFQEDMQVLGELSEKLGGLNTKFLEEDVNAIQAKLKDRALIEEIKSDIDALSSKIEEREAARSKIKSQAEEWENEGYVITALLSVLEGDIPPLQEAFEKTQNEIGSLVHLQNQLNGLDTKWFQQDAETVSTQLKNPANLEAATGALEQLKTKIDEDNNARAELKEKFDGWLNDGYTIPEEAAAELFDKPLAEVQSGISGYETKIGSLQSLETQVGELPEEDTKWFQDRIGELKGKLHDLEAVEEATNEFNQLKSDIAQEKQDRENIRSELNTWKEEEFLVGSLEDVIEDQMEKVKEVHTDLSGKIMALKEFNTKLGSLDAKWFQSDAEAIQGKLKDPAQVESIGSDLEALEAKINEEKEGRDALKAKYSEWQGSGFNVEPLTEPLENDTLAEVQQKFETFEKDLQTLLELQKKMGVGMAPSGGGAPAKEGAPAKKEADGGDFEEMKIIDRFSFDTFVVGTSNRFTHAAAQAVAESPAEAYNPLYIYGGPGLGKTHLLNAIGNFIQTKHKDSKVVYTTSEKFTNDLIEAVAKDTIKDFRAVYRSADVLIIDDIQFLAGKESTQEEFFHTFNTLYNAHKQIVISSDKPPKDIPTLEERLRSRFEGGLITDIQPPSLETKIIILRRLAKKENLEVPDEVMHLVASKIKASVRELEGALTKIAAYSNLSKRAIDMDLAKEVLKELVADKKDGKPTEDEKDAEKSQELMQRLSNLKKRLKPIAGEEKGEGGGDEDMAKCGNCGELIPSNSNKCPKCGVDFGGEWFECPNCGELVSGDSTECSQCGAKFETQ